MPPQVLPPGPPPIIATSKSKLIVVTAYWFSAQKFNSFGLQEWGLLAKSSGFSSPPQSWFRHRTEEASSKRSYWPGTGGFTYDLPGQAAIAGHDLVGAEEVQIPAYVKGEILSIKTYIRGSKRVYQMLQALELMVNDGWVTGWRDKTKSGLDLTTPLEGDIIHTNDELNRRLSLKE